MGDHAVDRRQHMRLCLCFMTSSLPLVVAIYVLAIRVHLSVGFVLHAFSSDASAHDNRPPRLRRILLSQNGGKIVKTPCSAGVPTISRSTLQLAASSGSEEDILLTFKPSGVEVKVICNCAVSFIDRWRTFISNLSDDELKGTFERKKFQNLQNLKVPQLYHCISRA